MHATLAESTPENLRPVLQLRDVTFQGQSEYSLSLAHAHLELQRGEMAIVHLKPTLKTREVASMLQGLIPPASGDVLFLGQQWSGHDFDRHFRMRSRIGRVFEGQAWVENLNVAENVTLARRHHQIEISEINADVKRWVKQLGLIDLSRKRPAFVEPSLLQLHQWIRAFILQPALLVLERPMHALPAARLSDLFDALTRLRASGTAVLWLTSLGDGLDHFLEESPDGQPRDDARHYRVQGDQLQLRQGGSAVE